MGKIKVKKKKGFKTELPVWNSVIFISQNLLKLFIFFLLKLFMICVKYHIFTRCHIITVPNIERYYKISLNIYMCCVYKDTDICKGTL